MRYLHQWSGDQYQMKAHRSNGAERNLVVETTAPLEIVLKWYARLEEQDDFVKGAVLDVAPMQLAPAKVASEYDEGQQEVIPQELVERLRLAEQQRDDLQARNTQLEDLLVTTEAVYKLEVKELQEDKAGAQRTIRELKEESSTYRIRGEALERRIQEYDREKAGDLTERARLIEKVAALGTLLNDAPKQDQSPKTLEDLMGMWAKSFTSLYERIAPAFEEASRSEWVLDEEGILQKALERFGLTESPDQSVLDHSWEQTDWYLQNIERYESAKGELEMLSLIEQGKAPRVSWMVEHLSKNKEKNTSVVSGFDTQQQEYRASQETAKEFYAHVDSIRQTTEQGYAQNVERLKSLVASLPKEHREIPVFLFQYDTDDQYALRVVLPVEKKDNPAKRPLDFFTDTMISAIAANRTFMDDREVEMERDPEMNLEGLVFTFDKDEWNHVKVGEYRRRLAYSIRSAAAQFPVFKEEVGGFRLVPIYVDIDLRSTKYDEAALDEKITTTVRDRALALLEQRQGAPLRRNVLVNLLSHDKEVRRLLDVMGAHDLEPYHLDNAMPMLLKVQDGDSAARVVKSKEGQKAFYQINPLYASNVPSGSSGSSQGGM